MNIKARCAVVWLGMLVSTSSWADDFYCGTHIISEGLTQGEVVQFCGQPAQQQGDTWVYNRGPEKLDVQLHFDGEGELERITELEHRGD